MCRQISIPAGFPRRKAIEILLNFENNNTDGVGYSYVQNGEFVVNKWPSSLSKTLMKEPEFLGHLPYPGWTICHLRAASTGKVCERNTHPFIVGENRDWAICHNGIWSDHSPVRLALSKWVKFKGETDTEVAAQLLAAVGPKKFSEEISYSGVFLALKKNGHLWCIKTSGEMSIFARKNETVLLASELPENYKSVEALRGWYHFGPDGKYISHQQKKESISTWVNGKWTGRSTTNYKATVRREDISCYMC